jgi:5-methylcytosine-specific restriction endonuclease McrA
MPRQPYGRGWKRLRLTILERDGWLCQIGRDGCTIRATCVDHIVPLVANGEWHEPTNLRAACDHCNKSRNTLRQVVIIDGSDLTSSPRRPESHREAKPSRKW